MGAKSVSYEACLGGTIQEVSYWGPIVVLGTDGLEYSISIVHGHSGPEFEFTETASSVARRAAQTRKESN